jgi:cytochrome c-type biogenesis protein CcmH
MTLWLAMALMTAAAVFAVLWPLGRARHTAGGSELAVYRDQLDEIARDRDVGRIGAAEAEAARIEVSRRLLAADAAAAGAPAAAPRTTTMLRRAVAVAALMLLPAGAVLVYLALGSPTLPGEPLAERLAKPPEQRSIQTLVAQVESHLERNPQDGRGWEIVAPVYLRLGRFEDAVKARFYLGLAAEQDGRKADAAKTWRELLAQAPQGATWAEFVREALARVDPSAAAALAPKAAPAAPGPSADDMAAAAEMPAEQRQAMIHGMVERLAARLKSDGADVDGWLRLMRAYMVLGERDKARSAAADARRALAGAPDKLRRIDQAAKGLGLDG